MPALFDQAMGVGIPDEPWNLYHRARIHKEQASTNAERAMRKLTRCKGKLARFVPCNLLLKKRGFFKSLKVFFEAKEHMLTMKKIVQSFDIYADQEKTETKKTWEDGLVIINSAYDLFWSAFGYAALAAGTRKYKKAKKEWQRCHQDVVDGVLLLKKAQKRNPSLQIAKTMAFAVDTLEIISGISLELDSFVAREHSLPDFEPVRAYLMDLHHAVHFSICWQHLWLTRYPSA